VAVVTAVAEDIVAIEEDKNVEAHTPVKDELVLSAKWLLPLFTPLVWVLLLLSKLGASHWGLTIAMGAVDAKRIFAVS
jgi:hypothetical protein